MVAHIYLNSISLDQVSLEMTQKNLGLRRPNSLGGDSKSRFWIKSNMADNLGRRKWAWPS